MSKVIWHCVFDESTIVKLYDDGHLRCSCLPPAVSSTMAICNHMHEAVSEYGLKMAAIVKECGSWSGFERTLGDMNEDLAKRDPEFVRKMVLLQKKWMPGAKEVFGKSQSMPEPEPEPELTEIIEVKAPWRLQ